MDIEKFRKRYQGPMMNQDIMNCIVEIERLKKELYCHEIVNLDKIERLKKIGNEMYDVLCSHTMSETDFERINQFKRWRKALKEK